MKVIGKRSVATGLKFLINAAWYIQLAAFSLALCVLVYVSIKRDVIDSDIPVKLREHQTIKGMVSTSADLWDAQLKLNEGMLHVKRRPSWPEILLMLGQFACIAALTLTITYLLRKIFATLTVNGGSPFIPENAVRLRKIAILIILLAPLNFINDFYNFWLVTTNFQSKENNFTPDLKLDFQTLLIGLVVLVIAEIFRTGTQLQEENELTV
jgi:hypothetical protein